MIFDGFAEQLLTTGEGTPRVLIVPPLFDEMNRMRRTLVLAMHALAVRGIPSTLMDLPGANESLAQPDKQSLESWRAAGGRGRGGGRPGLHRLCPRRLPDRRRRRCSLPLAGSRPPRGRALLKTLLRTRIAGEREDGRNVSAADLMEQAMIGPIELAGNRLGPAMVAQLGAALPAPLLAREVKPGAGENAVAGSALWLRAEPGEDAAMADAIAADIAALIA